MGLIEWIKSFLKPYVDRLEAQFHQKKLRESKVYYDLTLRVRGLEEFKREVTNALVYNDYSVDLSEYTAFPQESEASLLFQTIKTKPIRILIRGVKKVNLGLKYAGLVLLLGLLDALLLINSVLVYLGIVKGDLFYNLVFLTLSVAATVFVASLRNQVRLYIFVKVLGLHDPETNTLDLRAIIAGKVDNPNEEAVRRLSEDISMVYNIITKKFSRISQSEYRARFNKEFLDFLSKQIQEIQDKIAKLEMKYIKGEINKSAYLREKAKLEQEMEKIRDLVEL